MSLDLLSYSFPTVPHSFLPTPLLALVMGVIALLLIFAGRKVVKVLAFLVVGLIGASIGGALAGQYVPSLGTAGTILGGLIGFVAGGAIGLLLVAVGIGLAVGYAAYLLTLDVVSNATAAFVIGVVFFVVGLALYNKILAFVTAVAGAFLLYDALTLLSVGPVLSAAIAFVAFVLGVWNDLRSRRRSKAAS